MPHAENNYDGANLLFVVGSPRSGTTWVQRLLACHPLVRTGQESDLFDQYIGPQLRAWERDLDTATSGRNGLGLGCYHETDAFMSIIKEYALRLMEPMLADLPPGGLFLEKTPSHALYLKEIMRLFPRARVLHVLRDGRDVAASLLAASRGWGRNWAPRSAPRAGTRGPTHVQAARRDATAVTPDRFMEVRYEELLRHPQQALAAVSRNFLGLDWDDASLEQALADTAPGKQGGAAGIAMGGEFAKRDGIDRVVEPEGFVRKARSGTWREELRLPQRLMLWLAIRSTMRAAGYPWPLPWS